MLLTRDYLPLHKDKINLLVYFIYNGIVIAAGLGIYYFSSSVFKENINGIVSTVLSKTDKTKLPEPINP